MNEICTQCHTPGRAETITNGFGYAMWIAFLTVPVIQIDMRAPIAEQTSALAVGALAALVIIIASMTAGRSQRCPTCRAASTMIPANSPRAVSLTGTPSAPRQAA